MGPKKLSKLDLGSFGEEIAKAGERFRKKMREMMGMRKGKKTAKGAGKA